MLLFVSSREQARIYDFKYIRGLQHQLTTLNGRERIDVLNEISYAWQRTLDTSLYGGSGPKKWNRFYTVKKDSVTHYARPAYEESIRSNYKKGEGNALLQLAQGIFFSSRDERGLSVPLSTELLNSMDQMLNQSQSILEKINDHYKLAHLYFLRANMIREKSRLDKDLYFSTYQKGLREMELSGNIGECAEFFTWVSMDYLDGGYLSESLDASLKGLDYAKKWIVPSNSPELLDYKHYLVNQSLYNLSEISKTGGDFQTALIYIRESKDYSEKNNYKGWTVEGQMFHLYLEMGNADSAKKYFDQITWSAKKYALLALGQIQLLDNQYDDAIKTLAPLVDSFKLIAYPSYLMLTASKLATAYMAKGKYQEALNFEYTALANGQEWGRRNYIMPVFELIARTHYKLGNSDSAYLYLDKYIKLKDSIQNVQFLFQLHKAKKDASIALLIKDNQYQAAEIKRQAQTRNILIAVLLLLLITGTFIWRNIILRKKYEQLELIRRQAELQQQAQDLEMKALKAQMNPHFIFNSLSSINWFILKNKTQEASDYLTSFSRLIRMVLTNSDKPVISLDEELKMLRLYLDMEQLRLEHSFDYKIEMMNNIDPAEIYMPPMILQPFCENAIWHGLSHKTEKGVLTVNFELQENLLNCTIADNGVGREKADLLKNNKSHKEKSLGIQITKSRLSLFNGAEKESEYYNIEDVINEKGAVDGTKVTLKIKSKEVA
jgi:tetratricopeptide (TPR) repeat protein